MQKHFKKMFAGVASILLNDDNTVILGLSSREGEEVHFIKPVSTVDFPKINEWLKLVEDQMRLTLASSLGQAVEDIKQFKDAVIDADSYLQWIDRYQAQIVILAAQIAWSEDVESALKKMNGQSQKGILEAILDQIEVLLTILADSVLQEQPLLRRRKIEHLV